MNIEKLTNCVEVLGQVAINFADMPTAKEQSLEAALTCVTAQALLVKLAAYMAAGIEPYDAMEATAVGAAQRP